MTNGLVSPLIDGCNKNCFFCKVGHECEMFNKLPYQNKDGFLAGELVEEGLTALQVLTILEGIYGFKFSHDLLRQWDRRGYIPNRINRTKTKGKKVYYGFELPIHIAIMYLLKGNYKISLDQLKELQRIFEIFEHGDNFNRCMIYLLPGLLVKENYVGDISIKGLSCIYKLWFFYSLKAKNNINFGTPASVKVTLSWPEGVFKENLINYKGQPEVLNELFTVKEEVEKDTCDSFFIEIPKYN